MKNTGKSKLQIYLYGYSTHKNYDVEAFLKLSDEVRSSKELQNLKDRFRGGR